MEKKTETIKHNIFGGYAFYPITYKNKKYVITIKIGMSACEHNVKIFEYKEKPTFFKKHKGKKLYSAKYGSFFVSRRTGHIRISSIDSSNFTKYYPQILKNILWDAEKKLAEKEAEEKLRKENDEWDGVIQ